MSNYLDLYSLVADQANRFYETIQPILTTINVTQNLEAVNSITNNFYTHSTDEIMSLFNQMQSTLTPFSEPFLEYIAAINNNISITVPIQECLFDARQAISESEQLRAILHSVDFSTLFSEADKNSDTEKGADDYITTDSPIIREISIPDEYVFPVGNYRIRISAGHFWVIIGCIIAFLNWRFPVTASPETPPQNPIPISDVSDSQDLQKDASLLYKQNRILLDIFESVDITMSSQTDFIEEVKNYLQAVDGFFQKYQQYCLSDQDSLDDTQLSSGTDQDSHDYTQPSPGTDQDSLDDTQSSPGTDQSMTDNMNESLNTASEN